MTPPSTPKPCAGGVPMVKVSDYMKTPRIRGSQILPSPGGLGRVERGRYKDDGCEYAPSCLDCPLPKCRHDMTPKELADLLLRLCCQQAREG